MEHIKNFEEAMSAHEILPLRTRHMPEFVEPLEPREPENSFTETRCLRHDGWTPERKRQFLERFAECGVIVEACEAAGMSAKSVYNLRDRDPLFAAGLDAACVKARAPLADEAYSRARNGVVERIYRDGVIVAEKHRYDNRLTMAVLARLDSRIDRAEEKGAAHMALVARWEDYLDAVGEDRREEGLALLAPPSPPGPAAALEENSRDHELHELHLAEESAFDEDGDTVWEDEDGWWTDYPPPHGFDGEEEGRWGDDCYRRSLSPAEQAVIASDEAEEEAEEAEARAGDRAIAEARRDAYFGFRGDCASEGTGGGEGTGSEGAGDEELGRAAEPEPGRGLPGEAAPALQSEERGRPSTGSGRTAGGCEGPPELPDSSASPGNGPEADTPPPEPEPPAAEDGSLIYYRPPPRPRITQL
jgi:hypothetical protein